MKKPYEIVILSGKGGTGKTSITAAFASLAENSVFVDCDVDAADLHLILSPQIYKQESFPGGAVAEINPGKCTACGLCEELCRFDAIEENNKVFAIDEYACEGCGLCVQACPEKAISIEEEHNNRICFAKCRFGQMIYGVMGIAEENSGRMVTKIRQYAREIAEKQNASYIITDGPPGIGCPAIASVTGADHIIAVAEPTMSGWHDLQRLIEMIRRFNVSVNVIINKYDINREMAGIIEDNLKSKNINIIGKIPYNETMIYALVEGKTINEFEPSGNLAIEINRIWDSVVESKVV